MNCQYLPTFLSDYKKLRNKKVQAAVDRVTDQAEAASALSGIPQLQRFEGPPGDYRVRIGDYRIGLRVIQNTVIFMRCGHRREIYRRFP